VEALTGVHPDRLKEEQARGITIDLGFANLNLNGYQIGMVDVPGHERFIKNMLAGAGGIDAVLLVVAADESIKPQTREHFDICRLLNVKAGVVALTKADLADSELRELVRLEIQDFVRGSFLESAPIIPVSIRSGLGLAELKDALLKTCKSIRVRDVNAAFRLPVDRCFTLRGFGTVVTGTLVSGTLHRDEEVAIYPVGLKARIRSLQVHSATVDQAFAGQRTAVNLANVEVAQIRRGMEISVPGRFRPVTICDAQIELLDSSPVTLARKTEVRFHHGSAEVMAHLKPLSTKEIRAGQTGFVRILLEHPVLMLPGDRFIFRRLSPMVTLGGGTVLDIRPSKQAASSTVSYLESIASLELHNVLLHNVRRSGFRGLGEEDWLAQTALEKSMLRNIGSALVQQGRLKLISEDPYRLIDTGCFARLMQQLLADVETFHERNPLATGISKEQLSSSNSRVCHPLALRAALIQLEEQKKVAIENDLLRLAGRSVVLGAAEWAAKEQIERAFLQAGFKVPTLDEVLAQLPVAGDQARKIVLLLTKEKRLVKVSENLIFHSNSILRLKQILNDYKKQSERIDISTFKDLTDISRKYAIPLLEYLDREHVTRRSGDSRLIL
jgi:selenocysteine-specific elongation factor